LCNPLKFFFIIIRSFLCFNVFFLCFLLFLFICFSFCFGLCFMCTSSMISIFFSLHTPHLQYFLDGWIWWVFKKNEGAQKPLHRPHFASIFFKNNGGCLLKMQNIYTIVKNIRPHTPMWENLILVECLCLVDV